MIILLLICRYIPEPLILLVGLRHALDRGLEEVEGGRHCTHFLCFVYTIPLLLCLAISFDESIGRSGKWEVYYGLCTVHALGRQMILASCSGAAIVRFGGVAHQHEFEVGLDA